MKIEKHAVPESTIEEFADLHGLTMMVYERGKGTDQNMKFFAHFDHDASVAEDGLLRYTFGNGCTPGEAIYNYAREISEEMLVLNGNREDEKRIRVPRLRHQVVIC